MSFETHLSEQATVSGGPLAGAAEWVAAGGPVVMLLLAMSVLALTVALLKFYQFRSLRPAHRRLVPEMLRLHRQGQGKTALRLASGSPNPVVRVLALSINGVELRGMSESQVREEVYRVGADILERLRGYMRVLEVIANLAPLLGLFGTVLGMIEAFKQLQSAGAGVDPSMLSGGIWEALLTTAVGLAVAMPVVVLVNLFDRWHGRLAHEMNNAVTQVFTQDLSPRHEQETESHEAVELSGGPVPVRT